MKHLFLTCLVSFMLTSCKCKPTCAVASQWTQTASDRIAALLNCNNPDAIAADISGEVEKLNLCTKTMEQGVVTALVCKPVAVLVAKLAVNGLPATWGCSGGVGATIVQSTVYGACALIP
jgi:hypothetical protein